MFRISPSIDGIKAFRVSRDIAYAAVALEVELNDKTKQVQLIVYRVNELF